MYSKNPTVSVIVVAYKEIKYLPRAIESVLRQTYSDFEILIYSDRTLSRRKYPQLKADCRLKFIWQPNSNIFQTFNQGIVEAKGEYITFLEADDFWHRDKLRQQTYTLHSQSQVGLVYSWIVPINRQGKSIDKIIKHSPSKSLESDILQRNQIYYQSVMVRRSCFDAVGLFDSKLESVQDWDMWIRLSYRYQFIAIARPLVFSQQQTNLRENLLVLETDLQQTIEKAYQNLAKESLTLKSRSYAYASLHLAWRVLQHQEPDPMIAGNYRRQALEHSPRIGFSPFFLQVSLSIFMLYCLKRDRYRQLRLLIRVSQRCLIANIKNLKASTNALLKWMLEEDSFSLFRNRKPKRQGEDFMGSRD